MESLTFRSPFVNCFPVWRTYWTHLFHFLNVPFLLNLVNFEILRRKSWRVRVKSYLFPFSLIRRSVSKKSQHSLCINLLISYNLANFWFFIPFLLLQVVQVLLLTVDLNSILVESLKVRMILSMKFHLLRGHPFRVCPVSLLELTSAFGLPSVMSLNILFVLHLI